MASWLVGSALDLQWVGRGFDVGLVQSLFRTFFENILSFYVRQFKAN